MQCGVRGGSLASHRGTLVEGHAVFTYLCFIDCTKMLERYNTKIYLKCWENVIYSGNILDIINNREQIAYIQRENKLGKYTKIRKGENKDANF